MNLPQVVEIESQNAPDIGGHLGELYESVAKRNSPTVVELGVRHGSSTVAFLAGLKTSGGGTLRSVDILDWTATRARIGTLGLPVGSWVYTVGDSVAASTGFDRPVDVLLIDSSHARDHTERELIAWSPKIAADGVVFLHDTTAREWSANIMGAIAAFLASPVGKDWTFANRSHCNGLGILRRRGAQGSRRFARCRFPMTTDGFDVASGPTVLVSALSQSLAGDPRFAPLTGDPIGADEVAWFPVHSPRLELEIDRGTRIAIGPNVLFGNSQTPNAWAAERRISSYQNFQAIFSLSRWYVELLRANMKQKTGFTQMDYPTIPKLIAETDPGASVVARRAMVYLKGGPDEAAIARAIADRIPGTQIIEYGSYRRADLIAAAKTSAVCYYLSREDHYPLAAVEISLTGCPIVSDEKSCPVLIHGITGLAAMVRERGHSGAFTWSPDATERLISEGDAATILCRSDIRRAAITRHDPTRVVARIANALEI